MSSDNWQRIQELFLAAADLPRDDQTRFLDLACSGDDSLRQEVESLLVSDTGSEESAIAAAIQGEAQVLLDAASLIGTRLGAYRVLREIGRGGMGTVYLAMRADDQYQKQVAVKVVKRGMDTADVLDRFRHERQILAHLDHPFIARLMDAGTTEDLRPFFVMEYVEGTPVHSFCRDRGLNIQQRCRLFLQICEAVSYAHRNLVVHRDLKPGNIFVTANGTPKLLDFGVAKLLASETGVTAATIVTGVRRLTPDYASPEQFRGLPVSTATDVYSLGAVLYELLTDSRALQIQTHTPAELERIICDTEVQRPSARREQLAGDLDNIVLMAMRKEPERRYESVHQFAEDIQRYLDGRPIFARQDSLRYRAGKYVRRHRLRLIATALVIASLLSGLVIARSQARQAESSRQLAETERQKAVSERSQADEARRSAEREHEAADHQRLRAEAEAQKAKTEQQRAEQRLTQMVELANRSLFDVHSAIERLSGATPARREIVKTTLAFLEKLSKDAGQDDRLRIALSTAYFRLGDIQGYQFTPNLGDTAGALKSYRAAAALIARIHTDHAGDTGSLRLWVDIQSRIGAVQQGSGDISGSVRTYRDALPAARDLARSRPSDAPAVDREAILYEQLATALMYTNPAESIDYLHKALAILTKLASAYPDASDVLNILSGVHGTLGNLLQRRGDLTGGYREFEKCVAIREKLVEGHPSDVVLRRLLMIGYGHVGDVLGTPFVHNLGDSQRAREYFRKAVVIARNIKNGDPQDRTAQYDLAASLLRLGAIDVPATQALDSLAELTQAGEILGVLSKGDPKVVRYKNALGLVYEYSGHRLRDLGKFPEAIAEYRRSLASAEDALRSGQKDLPAHSQAIAAERAIASALAAQGDRAGAVRYANEALARTERYTYGQDRESRQMYLASCYFTMALIRQTFRDWPEACVAAGRAIAEWRSLIAGRENHPLSSDLKQAELLLRECESHLR